MKGMSKGAPTRRTTSKAYEGRYDEKYTRLKSMGGGFFVADDILRFADYIPLSFLTLFTFSFLLAIRLSEGSGAGERRKKVHHGSIHTSETFMHGARFQHR
jgi:hypothetical protein